MKDWEETKAAFRSHPKTTIGSIAGTLAWVSVFTYFSMNANWQGTCDHSGRRLWGFLKQLGCSGELLDGGWVELGLFAVLWFAPVFFAGIILWVVWKKISRGLR